MSHLSTNEAAPQQFFLSGAAAATANQPRPRGAGRGKGMKRLRASPRPVNRDVRPARSMRVQWPIKGLTYIPWRVTFLPDRKSAVTVRKAIRSKMAGAGGGTAAPAFVKGHPWRNEEIS